MMFKPTTGLTPAQLENRHTVALLAPPFSFFSAGVVAHWMGQSELLIPGLLLIGLLLGLVGCGVSVADAACHSGRGH